MDNLSSIGKIIRNATIKDLKAVAELEALCFPPKEAASEEIFLQRLENFSECFWLLEKHGNIISMVNGILTDERDLSDEMYESSDMHKSNGSRLMIFGVETKPEYRRKGYADELLRYVIKEQRRSGRQGIVLTCKENLVRFYEKFGFQNEGVSKSTHGDVVWYQMRLDF